MQRAQLADLELRYQLLGIFENNANVKQAVSRATVQRERPWASKRQPIDYKRCCTDRLNARSRHHRKPPPCPL